MIRIINGRVFNTSNATLLQRIGDETSFDALYMKASGELFLHIRREDYEYIEEMSENNASYWVTDLMTEETFRIVFGDIPDDDYERCLCDFSCPKYYIEYIESKAKDFGVTFSEMLEKMVVFANDKPALPSSLVNKPSEHLCSIFDIDSIKRCDIEYKNEDEGKDEDVPIVGRLVFIRKSIKAMIHKRANSNGIYREDAIADIVKIYMEEN